MNCILSYGLSLQLEGYWDDDNDAAASIDNDNDDICEDDIDV